MIKKFVEKLGKLLRKKPSEILEEDFHYKKLSTKNINKLLKVPMVKQMEVN